MAETTSDPIADLDAMLDEPLIPVEVETVVTEPVKEVEAQTEEVETVEPKEQVEEVEQPVEAEITQERFRFKDDLDRSIAFYAKSQGISLLAAAEHFRDRQPVQTEEVEQEQPIDHVQAINAELEELQAKKAALRAEAKEEMAPVDEEAIDAINDQISDLKEARAYHRSLQTVAAESAQAAEMTEAQKADAHYRELAYADFPDIRKEGTPLYEAVITRVQAMKNKASSPEQIYDIVASEAAKLRILPVEASNPSGTNKPGVSASQQVAKTAKASGLIPVSAKASQTPLRHVITHVEPDANTVFVEKIKNAKTSADIDEALGLESASVPAGRMGAWS